MKKIFTTTIIGILLLSTFAGCGKSESKEFDTSNDITVISREEGSGTRGAFIELFGIEEKDSSGKKIDNTIQTADINDSTGILLSNVAKNEYAIGYVSMGSLNDTVKAVKVDGVEATVKNIKDGSYKIARPFNIATKDNLSEVAQDFVKYILSTEGQAVVEKSGYIKSLDTETYPVTKPSGKIVIAGSSSVTPVMEKLKESYLKINTNATIEIQQSDSTTGMNSTIEGICDIGMASRDLKESETSKGLKSTKIATDGIAVIVNTKNTVDNLTVKQVKDIYTGKSIVWSDVSK